MQNQYRETEHGQEMRCPLCKAWTSADHVDNGIGLEQCGPYVCEHCGWVEMFNAGLPEAFFID